MTKIIQTKTGRDPYDFYDTPANFVKAVVDILPADFTPRKILDPGCGGGRWGNIARKKWNKSLIHGIDVVPRFPMEMGYDVIYESDFREWKSDTNYDLVIGNPPYAKTEGIYDGKLAEKFIRKSLDITTDHGYVFFLLKTVFMEGTYRGFGLFKEIPPTFIYQSVRRIPFRPELGSKSNTYAYSVWLWQKNFTPTDTRVRWFDWVGGNLKYMRDYDNI